MDVIIHETPGIIDIRAFTIFGINSKPNTTNPIGRFGTGAKFAIATLIREGCEVTVWRGTEPYVFFTKKGQFRDREFDQIYMKRKRGITARWFTEQLPYTTQAGRDWKVWMALRELHSNTLDEGGKSFSVSNDQQYKTVAGQADSQLSPADAWSADGVAGLTRIVVTGQAYVDAFAKINEVFLPEASNEETVQAVPRPSEHLFFRGLRALDLEKKSIFTWNVNASLELTEDRTVKSDYMAKYYVTSHVMHSKDKDFIKKILTAPDNSFEAQLSYDTYLDSSDEFKNVARLAGMTVILKESGQTGDRTS